MIKSKAEKVIQGIVTLILFVLIFCMIHYVNDIQGTARVVNYAGLVRGETQRMIKLEITGHDRQEEIQKLDTYVNGIKDGSQELHLIKVENTAYQKKVAELCVKWEELKQEIELVRENGYESTQIVDKSEAYFALSDEVVDLAEAFSQQCATYIRNLEVAVIFLIILLVMIMLKQSWEAIHIVKMNRELKEEVFWDKQTNLPNKNKCVSLLDNPAIIEEKTTVFMFDLNNLKYINDHIGHEAGDWLILQFSQLIRSSIQEDYFVGRYGGDEFIAIVNGEDQPEGKEILQSVRKSITDFNLEGRDIQISYAAGYACSESFDASTLRILLSKADQEMYIDKKRTKKETERVDQELENSLFQMVQALGNAYKDCCYCNAKTGRFRVFKHENDNHMPASGIFEQEMMKFVRTTVKVEEQERIIDMLSISYMEKHLVEKEASYDVICELDMPEYHTWWKITVMLGDTDEDGKLYHFIVAFQEITDEMELEYEAKHDGLTQLWNKTAAFAMIEERSMKRPDGYHIMLVLDIDNFKGINDSRGHYVGDQVIMQTAAMIQSRFKSQDIVARFGGDEFMVFVTGQVPVEEMQSRVDRILRDVHEELQEKYEGLSVTLSVGVAYADHKISLGNLFHEADTALYAAKNGGKNKYVIQAI